MIRPVGVPYGFSIIDDIYQYGVRCRFCDQIFLAPPGAQTEDEITKGAAAAYAVHYEKFHDEEEA